MTIHPTIRYDDADAAIRFLTSALGLTETHVSRDDAGRITHAELGHESDIVMIGTRADPIGPFDTGRAVIYLAVDEVDAHHDRAVAAGATVLTGLVDQPYGSREYAVTDPEGNVWSVGTYRPEAKA
ncbi:VOC family protein [Pseudonocardia sp. TRM90224]|uniref:VOC family protein n=1 Tax=Pseudonocardia sp. TRM90224 TaxID=2812678 RepID=UPI001E50A110|nr:VOC family protein [Pseudonocardia sp. TRM90224]